MRDRLCGALSACIIMTAVSGAMAQGPRPDAGDLVIKEAGNTATLQCSGAGNLSVIGAANTLKVTGPCKTVSVTGAANNITVELAEGARITITGAGNDIRYKSPAGSKPAISITGAGSKAVPAL
ncbi:DUF3060 domain-containing protein [Reyranella sp. CPCC 100927]|uniref:DUF3060 domain-containing protein n=1 Tax=Reyranella sp. CPCC 100927 TaxID=2599616 RepID=UPI0011B45139|nr:DUF3060 domain-containing protein [Reyranella sp. CPCC 100927]TWT12747.1 DUF3060 domain-containing protein [Reyranella sp. CPCC 100927]